MAKRKSKSGKQTQKQTKKKSSGILGPKKRSNDVVVVAAYRPAKHAKAAAASTRNPQSSHDEQRDFERQMNSLAERSRNQQQKRAATTKIRNRRKRGTTTPTAIALKPASFGLTKSTNQLMEETRLQMGQNKITTNGLPTSSLAATIATNGGGLPGNRSSLAAALASDNMTTPIASNLHKIVVVHKTANVKGLTIDDDDERWSRGDNRYSGTNQNSFRALGGGDSDDDDNEQSQLPLTTATTQSSPLISFAPASFSVGSLLPTKTPPVTPTTNPHYRYHPQQQQQQQRDHHRHRTAAATLFGKINEEEIEERHYQQQTTDYHDDGDPDL